MPDIVVTLPLNFRFEDDPGGPRGIDAWIAEGDPAGEPWSGNEWSFTVAGGKPNIRPGEQVYIWYNRLLRGYAPLVELEHIGPRHWGLRRGGGAVAVTIPEQRVGWRGWRYRWWDRSLEVPFPGWQQHDPAMAILTKGVDRV